MANRHSIQREANRFADWLLRDIGRELRVARLTAGMRLLDVGEALGTSISHVSRVEHGQIKGLGLPGLTRHAAAVGLKPYLKLFPAVARPLDRAQLALLSRFRERLGAGWHVELEVPMPIAGDLRATDAVVSIPGCRCMVELITRLADFQAQYRAAQAKQRDLGADRIIFVVTGTTTNRRAIRDIGPAMAIAFPISTKDALLKLGAGVDPGANALVLL